MVFMYVHRALRLEPADKAQSITRAEVSPGARPRPAGFSAFRWLMPIEKVAAIMGDKGPVHVVQNPGCMLQWDDTDRRLLAYPCSNNTIYNMLAYVPSSAVGVIEEDSQFSSLWPCHHGGLCTDKKY